METVRLPAPPATVQPPTVTDSVTLRREPPVPPPGRPTAPLDVETYTEPSDAVRVTVDRTDPDDATVTIQRPTGDSTEVQRFRLPAPGEAFDAVLDSVLRASVRGDPVDVEAQAEVVADRESAWDRMLQRIGWGVLLLSLATLLFFLRR